MQISFVGIILNPFFLGEPFDDRQIETAENWRRSVAHDHTYLDLAQTSLTARVCNGDGSLIISTDQAALIQQINNFLGLKPHELEATGFRYGILMAMLCILLWCLYLCNEFRLIFLSLEAVAQIPRSKTTEIHDGRFKTISHARFWTYCLLRFLRACIAAALLYAGVLWLGYTTSISDLILNAVALGAILEVDEMVFSALMPKKLQLKVQDLEAIKVQYGRMRSQVESVCILAILGGLLAWPWFTIVDPLGKTMELVKQAHCGGHQDFVVGLNEDQKMTVGFMSVPFENSTGQTLTQLAIDDFIWREDESPATYITFHRDIRRFQRYRTQPMKEASMEHSWCADFDGFFADGNNAFSEFSDIADYYRPYLMSARLGLGFTDNASCVSMQHKCDDEDAQLLRYVCGRTRCTDPLRSPWYKVPQKGCPAACLADAARGVSGTVCQESNIMMNPTWHKFWDHYPQVLSAELGLDLADNSSNSVAARVLEMVNVFKTYGCPALNISRYSMELVMSTKWCAGYEELQAPLAPFCPVTCGCTNLTDPSQAPAGCPEYCNAPCEDQTFPPINEEVANCADGAALGWCVADEWVQVCPKTCGACGA